MSLRFLGKILDNNFAPFFLDLLIMGMLHRYIKFLILDLL